MSSDLVGLLARVNGNGYQEKKVITQIGRQASLTAEVDIKVESNMLNSSYLIATTETPECGVTTTMTKISIDLD